MLSMIGKINVSLGQTLTFVDGPSNTKTLSLIRNGTLYNIPDILPEDKQFNNDSNNNNYYYYYELTYYNIW